MSDFLEDCISTPPEYGDTDYYEKISKLTDLAKEAYGKGDHKRALLLVELICHCSCEEFGATYLRHKMTVFKRREKKAVYYKSPQFHKDIYWELETSDKRGEYAMINAPRHHAKTTCVAEIYPLWKILTGRSHFVVIICESQTMAMERLANIRAELEKNTEIRAK